MPIDILLPAHTAVSIIAILAGIPVVAGLLRGGRTRPALTAVFLGTAFLTSASGYLFPAGQALPSHVIGAIALLVLAGMLAARRRPRLIAAGLVANLYLLVFVGIAQAFGKVAVLNALAPTLTEWPFAVAQGLALVLFLALGIAAVRRSAPLSP